MTNPTAERAAAADAHCAGTFVSAEALFAAAALAAAYNHHVADAAKAAARYAWRNGRAISIAVVNSVADATEGCDYVPAAFAAAIEAAEAAYAAAPKAGPEDDGWAQQALQHDATSAAIIAAEAAFVAHGGERRNGDWGGVWLKSDSQGNLVHCTATGRVEWSIAPDGATEVVIARPNGPVLRATVAFCHVAGRRAVAVKVVDIFYKRHLTALFEALSSLVRKDEAFSVCAPLWAQALED